MSGYIGTQPVPQATQTRDTFTATAGQTSFATGGYTPQFLDVYLNGVHLQNGTDYTASNGSDVVLTTGAAADDVLEVVAYTTFELVNPTFTGLEAVGDSDIAATLKRLNSDGDIVQFRTDGSTAGSIGNAGANVYIGSDDVGLLFGGTFATPAIGPRDITGASDNDAAINLGWSSNRFKDLYLSGGVYLGGTGSANKLDDYEEGTWTPDVQINGSTTGITYNVSPTGRYTKIGNMVFVDGYFSLSSKGSLTGNVGIYGLPFLPWNYTTGTSLETGSQTLGWYQGTTGVYGNMSWTINSGSYGGLLRFKVTATDDLDTGLSNSQITNAFSVRVNLAYRTSA